MSREPTEILVAVHVDRPQDKSIRVSIDGDDKNGVWIARAILESYHLTGQHTAGKDRYGNAASLPMANITIPEWLAKKEGFI